MTEDDVEIPRGIALAWGIPSAPDRRQKSDLSVERIISIALEIADESGLAAVSMAAVAGRLGYTPMSLYRYVAAKDDLVLLMGDAAFGQPPAEIADAGEWRQAVQLWVDAVLSLYERHPWLLDLASGGLPLTPNALAWMEAIMSAFATTDLTIEDTVKSAMMIVGQTRWEAIMIRSQSRIPEAHADGPGYPAGQARVLSTLVDGKAFPSMSRLLKAPEFFGEKRSSAFGLERAIDGLALYIDNQPPLTH